jgi:sigma-B regulation protein RsbU (phosphoserine phosphatase)
MSREPSKASAASVELAGGPWAELTALCRDGGENDRLFLVRLLELWSGASGASGAAIYLERGGRLELEAAWGGADFPDSLDRTSPPAGPSSPPSPSSNIALVPLGPGALAMAPPATASAALASPFLPLLALAVRDGQLRRRLKEQSFQVNFRGVELEALYDVGLAVAATLDLEQVSEEILLRAVSLLDARRGALYLLDAGMESAPSDRGYRAARTFGGEAGSSFAVGDPELHAFLAQGGAAPAAILPGARHLLGVAIEIEGSPRGFLAVGDKESRRGVGPFPPGDRRTLGLFANQAAIALENARLHRQALEKERLERELDLAAEIQRQILPMGLPFIPGFELIGWNRPARQVGGDYYDLRLIGEDRLSLVIGDVSGKGMPAALMVSTLHSALRLLQGRRGLAPAFLEDLNGHILESGAAKKFITLLVAELDPLSGRLTYLNAGHNPGLILRRSGEVEELRASGLPLGLLPGIRYESRAAQVGPGDLLCIYTDGITEAEAPSDEEFGLPRLAACLAEHRERPLPELVGAIDEAVTRFAAGLPQRDDQTVVLLRRG